MIRYKIDIMQTLADCGYIRQRLRDSKILSQSTIQNIMDAWRLQTMPDDEIAKDPRLCERKREGIYSISLEALNRICIMCGLRAEDIIEVVPTDSEIVELYKAKIRHA